MKKNILVHQCSCEIKKRVLFFSLIVSFSSLNAHQESGKSSDISFKLKLRATINSTRSDSDIPVCEAIIQPSGSTTFCNNGRVTLCANKISGYTYQWIKNEKEISGATGLSYLVSDDGEYQVKISSKECTAWSAPTKVTINDELTARITAGGSTTFCKGESVLLYANTCEDYIYQWKKDNRDLPGATGNIYVAKTPGTYQVKIIQGSSVAWSGLINVDVNSCGDTEPVKLAQEESVFNSMQSKEESFHVNVYPNPTTGLFSFGFCLEDSPKGKVEIKVVNSIGQVVYNQPTIWKNGCVKQTIELDENLPDGIYILQLITKNKVDNTKLLLNK
jgi:hypothetical protein